MEPEWKDNLISARKRRGMTQEELASQIGVSRQAVSKWETGETLPDLPKLMALANVLEVNMDALCGRQAPGEEEARPAHPDQPQRRGDSLARWLAGLLGVILLLGGFWGGVQWEKTQDSGQSGGDRLPLPDTFSVSGVRFAGAPDGVYYEFVAGVVGEGYSYQITFKGLDSAAQTFECSCKGGICSGTVRLTSYENYSVSASMSNAVESRAVLLATGLTFDDHSAGWTPA